MKVFISWSGILSQRVADALHRLLPCMVQGLDVFLSKHDLESGGRWSLQLAQELEQSSFGIICLTSSNQNAPWILYEAGALTKLIEGRACGLLLGELTAANVSGPLAQFQHRRMVVTDFELLLRDINAKLAIPLKDQQLRLVIDKWWPDLKKEYDTIVLSSEEPGEAPPDRKDRELLEEILVQVRALGSPTVFGNDEAIFAHQALKRAVAALPKDQLDFLKMINALKDVNDHAGVEEAVKQCAPLTDALISKGFLWRDEEGICRINRFLGDRVLRNLPS